MVLKRVLTSVVLLPIVLLAIWFNQQPLPWFTIVMVIWSLCSLYEFYHLARASGKAQPLVFTGMLLALLFIIQPHFKNPTLMPALLTISIILPFTLIMLRKDISNAFTSWLWTLGGILYIGWLSSYYISISLLDMGKDWLLMALLVIFASDIFAFFTGRAIGHHKMAPVISPSKTWEGAAGGVIGSIIVGTLLSQVLDLPVGIIDAIILSLVISILGQIGDLAESLYKRNTGVKDSGNALPGHGGFLDRIDSVVFAGLVVYYYVIWLV
jgi:phosphatidate cytidylyltransferase